MKNNLTVVEVWQKVMENGREVTRAIHKGIVVGQTTRFARVFCTRKECYDTVPGNAEWFPVEGKNSWLKETGELKKPLDWNNPKE